MVRLILISPGMCRHVLICYFPASSVLPCVGVFSENGSIVQRPHTWHPPVHASSVILKTTLLFHPCVPKAPAVPAVRSVSSQFLEKGEPQISRQRSSVGNRVWGGFADWKNFLGEIQEMGPCGSQPYPWWGQNLLRESDMTLPLCLLALPSEYSEYIFSCFPA